MPAGPPDHDNLLPVLKEPRVPFKPAPAPMRWLVRLSRAMVLVAAAFLIARGDRQAGDASDIPLDDVLRIFPTAARLGGRDPRLNGWSVVGADGERLGTVLQTSPQTDRLVGYSGPSNLLIGLHVDGGIAGVRLLWSRDTPEHVRQVETHETFWTQFPGWNPTAGRGVRIDAVSGSTLTSLAMAESIEARLAGRSTSLRFPEGITLAEVQGVFPTATELKPDTPRGGWTEVRATGGAPLGYVLRTSPSAESVRGYSGPTEALVAIDPSQRKVTAVRVRSSYDTAEYVERVRADEGFLESLAGKSIEDWTRIDFSAAGIEGVSGATQTSFGLAEGIRRRLISDVDPPVQASTSAGWKGRDLGLIAIIGGGLAVTFIPALGGRRVRIVWQIILVAAFGLWLGDMLSVSLAAGWSRHGMSWSTAPGLVALAAVAVVVPWTTRRQVYCHALCPHGAVQEWLGRERRLHVRLPRTVNRALGLLPAVLLLVAFALAVARPRFNLAWLEPFDAWVLGPAAAISFAIALAGFLGAMLVPQSYCRFGCPTGALLKLVRSHGRADRWSVRDLVATVAIGIAAAWVYWPAAADRSVTATESGPSVLTGSAFGTTWTVKIRDRLASTVVLQEEVEQELERIEAKLSHWRPASETAQFNASQTTLEIECSKELASLVAQGRELSEATDGAFDLTVGPLVDVWGWGPSGPKADPPSDETIRKLLESTGWRKLEVDESVPSLRKTDPAVQIDLGAVLQGFAVDRVHDLLSRRGLKEFLIEIGGELRAAGGWEVALDPAAGPWAMPRMTLRDQALSTSGAYRRGPAGEEKHILSPRTGRPIEAEWRAVAVLARTCREADGWDTAVLVSEDGRSLAEQRGLKVQTVPRGGGSGVQVGVW